MAETLGALPQKIAMNDIKATHMKLALSLAARGAGWVSPNPMVGAVVVREGQVVGRGYHRRAGLPHAEVEALRDAGEAARAPTYTSPWSPATTRATPALHPGHPGGRGAPGDHRGPGPQSPGHRRGAEFLAARGMKVHWGCWSRGPTLE